MHNPAPQGGSEVEIRLSERWTIVGVVVIVVEVEIEVEAAGAPLAWGIGGK